MATKIQKLRSFSYKPKTIGEVNKLPSEYVPDQTMTLREVVDRFTTDSPLPSFGKDKLFYSEDYPDMRFMDVTERVKIFAEQKASFAQLKADYDIHIKAERDVELKAQMENYKKQVIDEYIKTQIPNK